MLEILKDKISEMMISDPHPAVRYNLVRVIKCVHFYDKTSGWNLIKQIAENENNTSIIHLLVRCIRNLHEAEDEQVEDIILNIVNRFPYENNTDDSTPYAIASFALEKSLTKSKKKLNEWLDNYDQEEKRLSRIVTCLNSYILIGLNDNDHMKHKVRNNTNRFIEQVISKIEPDLIAVSSHIKNPTKKELNAYNILNSISDLFYLTTNHGQELPEILQTLDAQQLFLSEKKFFISKLTLLGTPKEVHYMIDMIGQFVPANPELCFDLFSEALLRTTGIDKYQQESEGARKFVELVNLYLADYRYLFDDENCRRKLIDCISIFVDAGWPEARLLFQNLPELI